MTSLHSCDSFLKFGILELLQYAKCTSKCGSQTDYGKPIAWYQSIICIIFQLTPHNFGTLSIFAKCEAIRVKVTVQTDCCNII